MEEFLKVHFVQYKQLIFEELGILTLNIIPAYFDKQNQQLFPTYFNYAFKPEKNLKNENLFFDKLAKYLNISNEKAQQLYKKFTINLIADFKKKSSFHIPHLAIIRHINNAYLVEIDSNLQMVFNPIAVQINKSASYKIKTIKNISDTLPPIAPPPIPNNLKNNQPIKQTEISVVPQNTNKLLEIKKVQSSKYPKKISEKKEIINKEHLNKKISTLMMYFIIFIVILALTLIGIKFFILNDSSSYLSSYWK